MNEKDAKTKWCPFARTITEHPNGSNHFGPMNRRTTFMHAEVERTDGSYCLGSKCMAWRWETKDTGYCGLAGVQRDVSE